MNNPREQLNRLNERREQLTSELEEAEKQHAEAQQALVQGHDPAARGAAAVHFSVVGSLRSAVSSIDEDISRLQQRLAAAEVKGREESTRKRLKRIGNELHEAESIFRGARVRADAALMEATESACDAYSQWQRLISEATSLRRALGESITGKPRISCTERLQFAAEIEAALTKAWDSRMRPDRAARKAKVAELNRRLREGAERRRQLPPAA